MIGDTTTGAILLARGSRLVLRREIRLYVIAPLLINICLFGALVWFGFNQFQSLLDSIMSYVPEFLDFIRWLMWIIVGLLAAIVVFLGFTPLANIVAAPFNALMSEKIETMLTGIAPASNSGFIELVISSVGSQLRKLVYILLWSGGLFLFSLIPVLNLIAPVLWVVFGSWLLSLEYLDYPMGNHDINFSDQKQQLMQRKGLALGFGAAVMMMTMIPLVNFFVMPVAVAGATLMWVEQLNPKNSDDPAAIG